MGTQNSKKRVDRPLKRKKSSICFVPRWMIARDHNVKWVKKLKKIKWFVCEKLEVNLDRNCNLETSIPLSGTVLV